MIPAVILIIPCVVITSREIFYNNERHHQILKPQFARRYLENGAEIIYITSREMICK